MQLNNETSTETTLVLNTEKNIKENVTRLTGSKDKLVYEK